MPKRFGAKKPERDPFEVLCEQIDRDADRFNGSYYKIVKEACDWVRSGEPITDDLRVRVEKEKNTWGKITSNRKKLELLLKKLNGEEEEVDE